MIIEQHTRFWRYLSRQRLLGKRWPKGKAPSLETALWRRRREALYRRVGRSAPSSPPGAARVQWREI